MKMKSGVSENVCAQGGLAGWGLEAFASTRNEDVSVKPSNLPPDLALPVVGFERNEPFRRLLGDLGIELETTDLNPGVVYHSQGRRLVRPSSVEGWIETGSEWFTGAGFRDFWENVWNLSVSAWNYVDEFGAEPVDPPVGFPYFHPPFWQGFRRNKLLFGAASGYLESFDIEPKPEFRTFIDSQIRFACGKRLEEVSMGLAAMILNAPSTSYSLGMGPAEARVCLKNTRMTGIVARKPTFRGFSHPAPRKWVAGLPHPDNFPTDPSPESVGTEEAGSSSAWRVGFQVGSKLGQGTPHQVFFENRLEGLTCRAVVLTSGKGSEGFVYFRAEHPNPAALSQALDNALGKAWGEMGVDTLVPMSGLVFSAAGGLRRTQAVAQWPWLGPVRAYLEARRTLL